MPQPMPCDSATTPSTLGKRSRRNSPLKNSAILCPAGTWPRTVTPSEGTGVPIATSTRATTTLSRGCRRITGPAMRFSLISITLASR